MIGRSDFIVWQWGLVKKSAEFQRSRDIDIKQGTWEWFYFPHVTVRRRGSAPAACGTAVRGKVATVWLGIF